MRPAHWTEAVRLHSVLSNLKEADLAAIDWEHSTVRTLMSELGVSEDSLVTWRSIAVGRIFNAPASFWLPGDLPLFELWPSRRRVVGHLLQSSVIFGLDSNEWDETLAYSFGADSVVQGNQYSDGLDRRLEKPSRHSDNPEGEEEWKKMVICELGQIYLPAFTSKSFFASWYGEFTREVVRGDLTPNDWALSHSKRWARSGFAWSMGSYRSDFLTPSEFSEARSRKINEWLQSISQSACLVGVPAYCRYLARHSVSRSSNSPEYQAFHWIGSCLNGENPTVRTRVDPIWMSLGRYLISNDDQADRDLLENAARKPDLYPEPLRHGLQFIVRGDIMLNDGSIITLDELSSEAGYEPLPMLDPIRKVSDTHTIAVND